MIAAFLTAVTIKLKIQTWKRGYTGLRRTSASPFPCKGDTRWSLLYTSVKRQKSEVWTVSEVRLADA